AFFPMSLAINQTPNPYVYEAETDTELHQVPASEAVAFLKNNPDVLFDLLSRLYKGVDGMLGRIVHLMAGSAKSRLLYELLIESRRFGSRQPDGSCRLAIKEAELAARAGLSRETVSREIQKLVADDLITISRSGILVRDIGALEKKLGTEL
ncbi:MAG TPA: Crp/Fnr family transcriptional regulator, partial [Candidatus Saccharimonadales bacterium]|nr:Crp/Fnr family transcriptional regulator [Candidatus Saccharimonadales bacterium]